MPASFDTLTKIDGTLERAGFHALTPFWREQLRRFYEHPTARTLIGNVGRGGAKSHTSAKVALNEALCGEWNVPPGEIHFWAYVSTNKSEAAQRLHLLESFLRALGIPHDRDGDTLTLRDLPVGFKVFAAQIGAVSGFRCFGYSADELAKWVSGSDYANPASEMCASLNAMTVTHPSARRLLISSPFGTDGFFYETFERGNTAHQITCWAQSWVANPGVTEAQCRTLEPDEKVFSREYGAEASSVVSSAFERDDVQRCFDGTTAPTDGRGFVAIDSSSLMGDAFSIIRGTITVDRDIYITTVDGFSDEQLKNLSMNTVADRIVEHCIAVQSNTVFADHFERAALRALLETRGVELKPYVWSESSKEHAVLAVRRWMRERKLHVVSDGPYTDRLRSELLALRLRLSPNGKAHYLTNGRDFASAVITLGHAECAGDILAPSNSLLEFLSQQGAVDGLGRPERTYYSVTARYS